MVRVLVIMGRLRGEGGEVKEGEREGRGERGEGEGENALYGEGID